MALDLNTNRCIIKEGDCKTRFTPACSFNIPLSLMGYDLGILVDENTPEWPYLDYPAFHESWKAPQTPKTWMNLSVVWYSRLLGPKIGMENMKHYLAQFKYGNQDMSGEPGQNNGITRAWMSSLKISVEEQVLFLKNLLQLKFPVSQRALAMTKSLLHLYTTDTWDSSWKLYGKTGTNSDQDPQGNLHNITAWFVGWIEKEKQLYVFALRLKDCNPIPTKPERIEQVRELLHKAGVF